MCDRTEKLVVCRDTSHERHRLVEKAHSSSFSEWNIDKIWSSQEWKSDELMDDRTVRPVVCPQRGAPQHVVIEDNEAELDLSFGIQIILAQGEWSSAEEAKPILKRCNERQRQTFCDRGMFMSSTLQASVLMVKNYSDNWHSIKKT